MLRRSIPGLALALAAASACGDAPRVAQSLRPFDPPAATGSASPRLAAFGDRVVLSWVESGGPSGPTLRFAALQAGRWSEARTVVADPQLALDPADVPGVIPLASGALAAHWTVRSSPTVVYARDLRVAMSADGNAWSAAQRPHRDGTATEHAMATLVPSAGARFGITWLDGRAGEQSEDGTGGTALYWADWTGDAFAPEVALDPRVCDCCKTAAAAGPAGPIVAYRDRADDERRDISVVRRERDAWSPPAPVRDDGWILSACPTNGPAIDTRGDHAAVAWFTGAAGDTAIRVALSRDGGRTLGADRRLDAGHPVGRVDTAVLPDGSAAVVWLERAGQEAEVRARRVPVDGEPGPPVTVATTSAARKSGYPRVVSTGGRDILVSWTDTSDATTRVRAAYVTLP